MPDMPLATVRDAAAPPPVRILIGPRPLRSVIVRSVIVGGTQIGVIGIGTAAGSAAMQWCGFALFTVVVFALARREPTYTAQEAADKLLADYGVRARA